MSKVVVLDMGAEKLRERLADLSVRRLDVGFVGERAAHAHPNSDDTTIAGVAAMVQFGTEDMDARPYFDLAIGSFESEVDLGAAAEHAVKGSSGVAEGLNDLGVALAKTVSGAIERVGAVDSGTLRDAATYVIEVDR